jgi:hypothetical protein
MVEYTLAMLAREFGTSKDVMKYHRKHLPDEMFRKDEKGVVWISETGKSIIQGKLRKEDYSPDFEQEVLQGLRRLEWLLDHTGSHKGKTEVSSRDAVSVLEKIRAYDNQERLGAKKSAVERQPILAEYERTQKALEGRLEDYRRLYGELKSKVVDLSSSTTLYADGRVKLDLEQYKKLVRLFPSEIKDYK